MYRLKKIYIYKFQMKFCWGASIWTSPVILPFLYRRGTFTAEGLASLTSYAIGVSIIISIAIIVRGKGA